LNLAARYADPGIGTAALRILSSRYTSLSSFHYEALLESYLKDGDLQTAFRILSIMAKAGLEADSSTTRALFIYLANTYQNGANTSVKQNCQHAWEILENMHREGHIIAPAAVNVILETLVYDKKHEEAIELYKQAHTISKANTETFNVLLRNLATSRSKHMAMFLASEMQALGLKPDQMTYDRLILVCSKEANYEDAFSYEQEMKEVGKSRTGTEWSLRKGTMTELFRRCVIAGDERAWRLLDQLKEMGGDTTELTNWAKQSWSTAVASRIIEWPKLVATSEKPVLLK
jgi:tetratricopeptide (TPR) repeat protein